MKTISLILTFVFLQWGQLIGQNSIPIPKEQTTFFSGAVGVFAPPLWGVKLSCLNTYKYPNGYQNTGLSLSIGYINNITKKTNSNVFLNYFFLKSDFSANNPVVNGGKVYINPHGANLNLFSAEYYLSTYVLSNERRFRTRFLYGANFTIINNTKGQGRLFSTNEDVIFQNSNNSFNIGATFGITAEYSICHRTSLTSLAKFNLPLVGVYPISFNKNLEPIISLQLGINYLLKD